MAGRDKRYVDPMFFIPEGIEDEVWAYRTEDVVTTDSEDFSEADDDYSVDSDVTVIDEGDASDDDSPIAVNNLTVVSQVLRRAQDGTQVVDIVVDVDDIPGLTKYEFRVTKV